jgi:hypothetical protein
MSSPSYESGNQLSDAKAAAHWPPRDTDELWDVFIDRETIPLFKGFSANALVFKNGIDQICASLRAEEKDRVYLPLEAGATARQVYKADMTEAHVELIEAAYSLTHAEFKATELSDENTIGRVWWQGHYKDPLTPRFHPMNFIEVHDKDSNGEYIKLQLVTDVPEDLAALITSGSQERPWLSRDEVIDIGAQAEAEIRQLIGDELVDEPHRRAA